MTTAEDAVAGASPHSGWVVLVTMTRADGRPVLADRRRASLIAPGLPPQPHEHQARQLPLAEAEALVAQVAASARANAIAALASLAHDLAPGRRLHALSIRAGPLKPLPQSVAEVLASYQAICSADGEMYRQALCDAARELGLALVEHPRATPPGLGRLGLDPGPPWTQEHKSAAAFALQALDARAGDP